MGNLLILTGAIYAAALMFQMWSYTLTVKKTTDKVKAGARNAHLVSEEVSCY